MAGIFDEVIEGIAEREKATPPAAPGAAAPPPAGDGQTPPPGAEEKAMHGYSEAFKAQYGERKGGK